MRPYLSIIFILIGYLINAQVYIVNTNDDKDDGVCDGLHCSFREALNAAEKDNVPSTILFDIPFAGPHIIKPKDTFPTITKADLTIIGESQPGGLGSIVIDFNRKSYNGRSFWHIDNQNFLMSGIEFKNFFYQNIYDHILSVGSSSSIAKNVHIYNCAFHSDTSVLGTGAVEVAIQAFSCDSFIFRKNVFGTDFMKSKIFNTLGYLRLDDSMKNHQTTIDSNIFVNKFRTILLYGGDYTIKYNLFGALDTMGFNSSMTQLGPDLLGFPKGNIQNNYFIKVNTCISASELELNVLSNTFRNVDYCIWLGNGSPSKGVLNKINIYGNKAISSKSFLLNFNISKQILTIEGNEVYDLNNFCSHIFNSTNENVVKHINNKIYCITSQIINNGLPDVNIATPPVVSSVINNTVVGTSKPFDSISVYANPRINCENANCGGGFEIGRTQCDKSGNWTLSNYTIPDTTQSCFSISAYAYNPDASAVPNTYSEFSNCVFTGLIKIDFIPALCFGQVINYRGKTYSEINPKDSIYLPGNGTGFCDTAILVQLNFINTIRTEVDIPICYDDTISIGSIQIHRGKLVDSIFLKSAYGCDSIFSVKGKLNGYFSLNQTICDNDSIIIGGVKFNKSNTSGLVRIPGAGQNGCDSIINVMIMTKESNNVSLNLIKCDSTTINGIYYDRSGMYSQRLKSVNGCDSTLNIDLTIGTQSSFNYKLTSCDSAFIVDKWYYLSGNYTKTLLNTYQCDSTLNIALTINKSTSGDTIFRSCDSVTINGITYRQTGIYQQTLSNAMLCDSMLIIDFTRLSKSSTNLKYKVCDSIELNKIVYRQTGLYSQKLSNVNQCDSLLSLDITINKGTTKDSTAQGCDSLVFNGQTYYQTGIYNQKLNNADLCDSSLNLFLTIYKSSSSINVLKACDSVFKFGKWFYQSGNYPQYLKDVHQCDSTVNFHLTINNGGQQTIYKTACDSLEFSGIWFNKSGQYNFYLLNTNGCDSTITLDLTIKPGNQSTLDAGKDTSICEGDILKLNGVFSGNANFSWQSSNGNFDNPNNLVTNFYSKVIGDERIYLQASDDCKQWIDSINVHIFPRRVVQVTGDTIVNPCKEISFTAYGGTNYIWTPSSFIECLDPPCSRVILKSNSITRFTISTDGPCAIPASLNLSLSEVQTDVYLPNAFSPNGDNINDVFLPVFNCEQVDYFSLQIFDRWGNLLFESQSKDKGWNGKSKDQIMNPGVYPYVLQYQVHGSERRAKAGDVTLVR